MKNLKCIKNFQIGMTRLAFAQLDLPKPSGLEGVEDQPAAPEKSVDLNNAKNYKLDSAKQIDQTNKYIENLRALGHSVPGDINAAHQMMVENLSHLETAQKLNRTDLSATAMQRIDKAFDLLGAAIQLHIEPGDPLGELELVKRTFTDPGVEIYDVPAAAPAASNALALKPSEKTESQMGLQALFESALNKIALPNEKAESVVEAGKVRFPDVQLSDAEMNALKIFVGKETHLKGMAKGNPYILDVSKDRKFIRVQLTKDYEIKPLPGQSPFLDKTRYKLTAVYALDQSMKDQRDSAVFNTLTEEQKREQNLERSKTDLDGTLSKMPNAPFGTTITLATEQSDGGKVLTRAIRRDIEGYSLITMDQDGKIVDEKSGMALAILARKAQSYGEKTVGEFTPGEQLFAIASAVKDLVKADSKEAFQLKTPEKSDTEKMIKEFLTKTAKNIAISKLLFNSNGEEQIKGEVAKLQLLAKQYPLDSLVGNWKETYNDVTPVELSLKVDQGKLFLAIDKKPAGGAPETRVAIQDAEKEGEKPAPMETRVARYEIGPVTDQKAAA